MCHVCLFSIQRQYFVSPGQISQLPFPGSLPIFFCFLSLSLWCKLIFVLRTGSENWTLGVLSQYFPLHTGGMVVLLSTLTWESQQ